MSLQSRPPSGLPSHPITQALETPGISRKHEELSFVDSAFNPANEVSIDLYQLGLTLPKAHLVMSTAPPKDAESLFTLQVQKDDVIQDVYSSSDFNKFCYVASWCVAQLRLGWLARCDCDYDCGLKGKKG